LMALLQSTILPVRKTKIQSCQHRQCGDHEVVHDDEYVPRATQKSPHVFIIVQIGAREEISRAT
jgi:hypothetical protein